MKIKLFIATLLLMLFPIELLAKNWRIEGLSLPTNIEADLKNSYPTISDNDDIEKIIEKISTYYPSAQINQSFDGQNWIISIERKLIVASITATALTNSIANSIERSVRDFRGQTFSNETKKEIIANASEALKKIGFPNSEIILTEDFEENRINISIEARTGKKCTISDISFNFTFPKDARRPSIEGQICNEVRMIRFADEIEKNLKEQDYAFSTVDFKEIIFNADNTRGVAVFNGKVGKKIEYRFNTVNRGISIEDLIPDLKSQLSPQDYSPYSVKTEVLKEYQSRGYSSVIVSEPKIESSGENKLIYIYDIYPGVKMNITNILTVGVNLFTNDETDELLKPNKIWGLSTKVDLIDLEEGIRRLKNEYLKRGYWDVVVREPRLTTDPASGDTSIVVLVDEGLPRVFMDLQLSGNNFISDESIKEQFPFKQGKTIDRLQIIEFEKELNRKYFEAGFIYAKTDLSIYSKKERRSRPSTIIIKVEEGPRVKFGDIFILGLVNTHRKVIQRELEFLSGEYYSPEKIKRTKQKLINIGIFRAVSIEPTDKLVLENKGQIVDVSIILKESEAGLVSFGPGYDIFKGYNYVVEASYKNISGMARRFSVRSSISQDKEQEAVKSSTLLGTSLGIGFIEPYLASYPIDGRLSLSHKAVATSFWEFSTIGQEEISYSLDDTNRNFVSLFARQKINLEVGTDTQTALYLFPGNTQINSFGGKLELDLRDNISWPTRGVYLSIESEKASYALQGNVKFDKIDIMNNYYHDISKLFVLALGLQYTKFNSIDRNDSDYGFNTIPASEALYAGGSELVRGYKEQLGPYLRYFTEDRNGDETVLEEQVVGGTARFVSKFELRTLISENSAISLFYDAGNSYIDKSELDKMNVRFEEQNETNTVPSIEENFIFPIENIFTDLDGYFKNVYTSTGVSYNYLTPLGSFRFGFAYPLKQPKSLNCSKSTEFCFDRRHAGPGIFNQGKLDISIAAKF